MTMGIGAQIFHEERAKRAARPVAKGLTEAGWDNYLKGLREREANALASLGHGVDELERRLAAGQGRQPTAAELREKIGKLENQIMVTKAAAETARVNGAVDRVFALLEKSAGGRDRGPLNEATELLRDAAIYRGY